MYANISIDAEFFSFATGEPARVHIYHKYNTIRWLGDAWRRKQEAE